MNETRMRAEQRYQILLSMLDHTGRNGLHYTADRDELRVTVNMPAGLVRTQCRFAVHDDKDVITMHIGTNVFADDTEAQRRVMKKMNALNNKFIQGRFYLDTTDNEIMFGDGIRFAEVLPSEDMLRDMMMVGLSSVRYEIQDLVQEILASEQDDWFQQALSEDDSDDDNDDDLIEVITEELADEEDGDEDAGEGEADDNGADEPDEEE